MELSPKVRASIERASIVVDGTSHSLRLVSAVPDRRPPLTPAFASFTVETRKGHELIRVVENVPLDHLDDVAYVVGVVVDAVRAVLAGERVPAARVLLNSGGQGPRRGRNLS